VINDHSLEAVVTDVGGYLALLKMEDLKNLQMPTFLVSNEL